jgi:hypothetical protein
MTAQRTLEWLERLGRGMIGLTVSAGFGALVGLRTGALVGGAVGTIVPILGNIVGFFIGAVVGAVAGIPSGVLCGALQGRIGCRVSGVIGAMLIPCSYVRINGEWSATVRQDAWLIAFVFVACVVVGAITGNWVWRKLECEPPGMFSTWGRQNKQWGLYDLNRAERLLSAFLLFLPALVFLLTRG